MDNNIIIYTNDNRKFRSLVATKIRKFREIEPFQIDKVEKKKTEKEKKALLIRRYD